MGRSLAILAITGSILAGLSAFVLAEIALLLPAAFAIGAGIFFAISRDPMRLAPAIAAMVVAVLGVLGTIGSVGGEDGAVEFGISVELGVAFIVMACLMFPASIVLQRWGDEEPEWLSYLFIGLVALPVLLAFIFHGDLPDHAAATTLIIGVLALASVWPGVLSLRDD